MSMDHGRDRGPMNDASGYAGPTSQQVLSQHPYRKYLLFQNLDLNNAIWINFGSAPATKGPGSIKILPGGSFEQDNVFCTTDAMSVIADAGSPPYTLKVSSG